MQLVAPLLDREGLDHSVGDVRGPRSSEHGWGYVEERLAFSRSWEAVLQGAHWLPSPSPAYISQSHSLPWTPWSMRLPSGYLQVITRAPYLVLCVPPCIASFYPVGQCLCPRDCKSVTPSGHWKVLSQHREKNHLSEKQSRRTTGQDLWTLSRTHLDLFYTLAPPHFALGTLYFISPSFYFPVNVSWLWPSPSISTLGLISSFWYLELPTCFLRTDLLGVNTGVCLGLWGFLPPPFSIGTHQYFAQYWQKLIFKRHDCCVLFWIASQLYHTYSCFAKAKSRANDHMGI